MTSQVLDLAPSALPCSFSLTDHASTFALAFVQVPLHFFSSVDLARWDMVRPPVATFTIDRPGHFFKVFNIDAPTMATRDTTWTRRVIVVTQVIEGEPFGQRTNQSTPKEPMGAPSLTTQIDDAISIVIYAAEPFDATGFRNCRNKPRNFVPCLAHPFSGKWVAISPQEAVMGATEAGFDVVDLAGTFVDYTSTPHDCHRSAAIAKRYFERCSPAGSPVVPFAETFRGRRFGATGNRAFRHVGTSLPLLGDRRAKRLSSLGAKVVRVAETLSHQRPAAAIYGTGACTHGGSLVDHATISSTNRSSEAVTK